jgi:hypothetical protein
LLVSDNMAQKVGSAVFHTLSEVKGTDTLSQEKKRVFTPFPD